jgi:hypothetical protein
MTLAASTGVLTLAHRQMITGIRDQWAGTAGRGPAPLAQLVAGRRDHRGHRRPAGVRGIVLGRRAPRRQQALSRRGALPAAVPPPRAGRGGACRSGCQVGDLVPASRPLAQPGVIAGDQGIV